MPYTAQQTVLKCRSAVNARRISYLGCMTGAAATVFIMRCNVAIASARCLGWVRPHMQYCLCRRGTSTNVCAIEVLVRMSRACVVTERVATKNAFDEMTQTRFVSSYDAFFFNSASVCHLVRPGNEAIWRIFISFFPLVAASRANPSMLSIMFICLSAYLMSKARLAWHSQAYMKFIRTAALCIASLCISLFPSFVYVSPPFSITP